MTAGIELEERCSEKIHAEEWLSNGEGSLDGAWFTERPAAAPYRIDFPYDEWSDL